MLIYFEYIASVYTTTLALSPITQADMVNPCHQLDVAEEVQRVCGGISAKYVVEPNRDELMADSFVMLKRFFHSVRSQYWRKKKAKEKAGEVSNFSNATLST